jgi:hypothetical protein
MYKHIFRFWERPSLWHRNLKQIENSDIDYILSCQDISGGFSNWPNSTCYLETCYYATVCLGLNGSEHLCRENTFLYILSHYNTDGGFKDNPYRHNSNIFNTFYGLISLGMLNRLDVIDKERSANYLLKKLRQDGGFSEYNDDPSSLLHTFWSILSLDTIGYSTIVSRKKIRDFILSCHAGNGLFSNYSKMKAGYIEYSAYAIILNDLLGLDINLNFDEIISAIKNRQIKFGYSSIQSMSPNTSDTFWAFFVLCSCVLKESNATFLDNIPFNGIWSLFIKNITLILSAKERVLPNPYSHIKIKRENLVTNNISSYKNIKLDSYNDIEKFGFSLYKALSLRLKEKIKALKSGFILEIDNEILDIQWENLLIGNSLLQLTVPLIRLNNRTSLKKQYEKINSILVLHDGTTSAIKEYESINRKFNDLININISSLNDTNLIIFDNKYDIVHICGHNMRANDKKKDIYYDIVKHLRLIDFRGILIANTCIYNNNILLLFKMMQCQVVAYNGLLKGDIGHFFINSFYDQLLNSQNIAEAFRVSKNKTYYRFINSDFSWSSYQLWGSPNNYYNFQ